MPSSARDTYWREVAESLVLAQNEFREFLTFYPTNARATTRSSSSGLPLRADAGPDRDQTETKERLRS